MLQKTGTFSRSKKYEAEERGLELSLFIAHNDSRKGLQNTVSCTISNYGSFQTFKIKHGVNIDILVTFWTKGQELHTLKSTLAIIKKLLASASQSIRQGESIIIHT